MPEAAFREILCKLDSRGQGNKTALLKFNMAMFREHDQGPGQERGDRRHTPPRSAP